MSMWGIEEQRILDGLECPSAQFFNLNTRVANKHWQSQKFSQGRVEDLPPPL